MKRSAAVLATLSVLCGGGCTAGTVAVLAPPGAARPEPNAPGSEPAPPGLIRYLHVTDEPDLQKKIRAKTEKQMRLACGGAYTIEAEGPDASAVAGSLSTSLPPVSMGEGVAVGLAQLTAAVTAGQYWYIRFTCQGR